MDGNFPVSLHERVSASRSRIHDLQDRVCNWISKNVGEEGAVPNGVPFDRYAHQGASVIVSWRRLGKLTSVNQTSCDKLIREMEMFGEDLSGFEEASAEEASQPTAPNGQTDVVATAKSSDPSKGKKGKIQNKSTGLQYQFQIMELIGVPRSEIKKFADPMYWAEYFPPIAIVSVVGIRLWRECRLNFINSQSDLNDLGGRIDWRRSFVTSAGCSA